MLFIKAQVDRTKFKKMPALIMQREEDGSNQLVISQLISNKIKEKIEQKYHNDDSFTEDEDVSGKGDEDVGGKDDEESKRTLKEKKLSKTFVETMIELNKKKQSEKPSEDKLKGLIKESLKSFMQGGK